MPLLTYAKIAGAVALVALIAAGGWYVEDLRATKAADKVTMDAQAETIKQQNLQRIKDGNALDAANASTAKAQADLAKARSDLQHVYSTQPAAAAWAATRLPDGVRDALK